MLKSGDVSITAGFLLNTKYQLMSFSCKEQDVESLPHFHVKLGISKYVLNCLEVGGEGYMSIIVAVAPFGLIHPVPQTKRVATYNNYYISNTMYCHLVKFHYQFHGLWVRDGELKARSHRRRPDFTVAWALRPPTIGGVFRLHFIALSAKCRRRGDKIRKFSEEQWLEMRLVCATATSPHARNERQTNAFIH